jgi:site-specific recombinase XerD
VGKVLNIRYSRLYEDFLAYQKPRVTASTYYTHRSLAYRVIKWFEGAQVLPKKASVADMLRYKEELSETFTAAGKLLAAGTINQYLIMARVLFEYLVLNGQRLSNPMQEVLLLREPLRVCRNYLTEIQMFRLLTKLMRFDEAPDMQSRRRRYRVHVIAEVLYATGLRQRELVLVEERHINLYERTIFIPCGKGELIRTVFLTGFAVEVLRRYLSGGRAAAIPEYKDKAHPERVFGSWVGDAVQLELRRLCREMELPVITCHGFRHSLGTHLLRAGCDIRHIQTLLGHQNINSTTTYTHLDKDDLKKSFDAYHPRQWKKEEKYNGNKS